MRLFCLALSIVFILGAMSTDAGAVDYLLKSNGWWGEYYLTAALHYSIKDYSQYASYATDWSNALSWWMNGSWENDPVLSITFSGNASTADILFGVNNLSNQAIFGSIEYSYMLGDYAHVLSGVQAFINLSGYDVKLGYSITTTNVARSAASHEIGHLFGLSDMTTGSVIMNTYRDRRSIYRPKAADFDGAEAFYDGWDFDTMSYQSLEPAGEVLLVKRRSER